MTTMDYSPLSEFEQSPQAAGVPAEWNEPVTIGVEPDSTDTDSGFVDDRFEPTGFGGGYDEGDDDALGESEPEAVADPTPTAADVGSLTTATAVERPTGTTDAGNGNSPADDHTPEDEAATSEAAAADVPPAGDTPSTADGPGDVPPELPPLVTVEDDPGRGQALKDVVMYAESIGPELEARTHNKVLETYSLREIQDHMLDRNIDNIEEAVGSLGNQLIEGETTIRAQIVDEELRMADYQYGDRLRAAGLELANYGDDIALVVEDVGYFTAAVGQLPPATHPDEQAAYNQRFQQIVDSTTYVASQAIIADNPGAADVVIQHNEVTRGTFPPDAAEGSAISDDRAFAALLAENAATLATNLEAKGAPAAAVNPIRQLSLAHAANPKLTVEWAAGCAIGIVGSSSDVIGLDRVNEPEQWGPVFSHLEHLKIVAPNDEYTRSVVKTVLDDIERGLAGPQERGEESYHPSSMYEDARPTLEYARARIRHIFGIAE